MGKVVGDGNISEKKFSNLMNLKTLYLGLSFKSSDEYNKNYLTKGIELSKFSIIKSLKYYPNRLLVINLIFN